MPGKVQPRDVTPIMQAIRNFLLGRKHNTALRNAQFLAARTQPQPELPDGPCHLHANNYYYTRDARREVKPPLEIKAQSLLTAASPDGEPKQAITKKRTPGNVFLWDQHNY